MNEVSPRHEASPRLLWGQVPLVADGTRHGMHLHEAGQFTWPRQGVVIVVGTACGTYVIPPTHAIWIPGEALHAVRHHGGGAVMHIKVHRDGVRGLPGRCCAVRISKALESAIAPLSSNESQRDRTREQDLALLTTLETEIVDAGLRPLALRIPGYWGERSSDARIAPVIQALLTGQPPSNERSASEWAHLLGLSERALLEAFERETGLPFAAWQKQVRILRGLVRLAAGENVSDVAAALHYRSPSAFIHAFRTVLRTTPKRYYGAASRRPD